MKLINLWIKKFHPKKPLVQISETLWNNINKLSEVQQSIMESGKTLYWRFCQNETLGKERIKFCADITTWCKDIIPVIRPLEKHLDFERGEIVDHLTLEAGQFLVGVNELLSLATDVDHELKKAVSFGSDISQAKAVLGELHTTLKIKAENIQEKEKKLFDLEEDVRRKSEQLGQQIILHRKVEMVTIHDKPPEEFTYYILKNNDEYRAFENLIFFEYIDDCRLSHRWRWRTVWHTDSTLPDVRHANIEFYPPGSGKVNVHVIPPTSIGVFQTWLVEHRV